MWSFVGSKQNKQWIWLAVDADSREIVDVFDGDRSRQAAKGLWQSLSAIYRQCAICYTNFWKLMSRCYQASGIALWAKKRVKLAILSGSTTLCGSELGVWFIKPYRSPEN
jgi:IS1 family transposase